MILGYSEILWRLKFGHIFRDDTWSKDCIKEASYALRVAPDGWVINGDICPPGEKRPNPYFRIEPGAIAILSTIERLNMPRDIVGHLGVRYDYAAQGLTGLMGIQVDPAYGRHIKDERIYIRVANLSNHPVTVDPGESVFNIEFREMKGKIQEDKKKENTWDRLLRSVNQYPDAGWSYVTRVQDDLDAKVENVRQGLQPIVMFGVFLVAATLLGVAIAVILTLEDIDPIKTPPWVTNWGWVFMMVSIGASGLFTAAIGVITTWHFYKR